jgi:hypothetical protein
VNFQVTDCEQRSPEWLAARVGKITASRADAVRAKKDTAKHRDYVLQAATEVITGVSQESLYLNQAMQNGIDREPLGRGRHEAEAGELIEQVGFLTSSPKSTESPGIGCSIDGHINGFHRLVGIKCPKATTHVRYMLENRLPPDYLPQVLHEMTVVDTAESYDFVSFCPEMPEGLDYWYITVPRSELAGELKVYTVELALFRREIEALVKDLYRVRERHARPAPFATIGV